MVTFTLLSAGFWYIPFNDADFVLACGCFLQIGLILLRLPLSFVRAGLEQPLLGLI